MNDVLERERDDKALNWDIVLSEWWDVFFMDVWLDKADGDGDGSVHVWTCGIPRLYICK